MSQHDLTNTEWFTDGFEFLLAAIDKLTAEVAGRAKAICAGCRVIDDCRDWGLGHELYGIFGGLSEKQRRQIRGSKGLTLRRPELDADVPEHGTNAGYYRHRRLHEAPCVECVRAHATHYAMRREEAS